MLESGAADPGFQLDAPRSEMGRALEALQEEGGLTRD
jgi:hypothetical protein